MTCPRDAAVLWHVCVLSWICEKNHIKKIITIHNILKEKTTKLYSQSAQYQKNKIDKNNYEKNKKNKKKKMTILEEKKAKK